MSPNGLEEELTTELSQPFDVMLDPSMVVSERKFEKVRNSGIFEMRYQSTVTGQRRINEIYIPGSFVDMLEDSGPIETTKTEAWNFYRKQSNSAFPNQILEFLDEKEVSRYRGTDDSYYRDMAAELNWEHALGDEERYRILIDSLSEEFVFLASHSKLLSRASDTIDKLRDAGVPVIDVGDAELRTEVEERLRDIGHRDLAKYCAFGLSNASPAIDQIWGAVIATTVDVVVFNIDP